MSQAAPRRRRPWLRAFVIGALVLVVGVVGVSIWAFRSLNANITSIDTTEGLGDVRPLKENQALNVLLIGSDSREGENDFVGGDSPGLSDTVMVAHIAEDDSWAAIVSVPRDSMVEMPECLTPDGSTHPAGLRQFNQAYSIGGPVCVQKTLESLTGLYIDHFVDIDFQGFVELVDAIGGVTIYIDAPISDPNSDIYFDTGCQTLNGEQALDYVRVRHGVEGGDGSDTERIQRQQEFLTTMVHQIAASGLLYHPAELYKVLDVATSAITTDTGLDTVGDLASLALRVRHVGLGGIDFTTVPSEPWPPDPNRLQWTQPAADDMWDLLRADQPLTPPTPSATPSDSPTNQDPGATDTTVPGESPSASTTSSPADEPVQCPTPS